MRINKFRAWHKPSRKWWSHEETLSVLMLQGRVLDGIAEDKGFLGRIVIEQFTGLLDKSGKEIYEGDIVVLKAMWGGMQAVIIFQDGCFGFMDGPTVMTFQDTDPSCWEIIGNIHQTPELI